jgi:glycerol-3-phosphate dehydrogenase
VGGEIDHFNDYHGNPDQSTKRPVSARHHPSPGQPRYGFLLYESFADGKRRYLCFECLAASTPVFRQKVIFAVREEMAVSSGDLILRRTELGSAGYPGRLGG